MQPFVFGVCVCFFKMYTFFVVSVLCFLGLTQAQVTFNGRCPNPTLQADFDLSRVSFIAYSFCFFFFFTSHVLSFIREYIDESFKITFSFLM